MKNLLNNLLKFTVIILLLSLYWLHFSFEQYEIMRFILIASFAWMSLIEKEASRKGWRFLFAVLVILFNPFYKLKIGLASWKLIDVSVAVVVLINLLSILKISGIFSSGKEFIVRNKHRLNLKKLYRLISIFSLIGLVVFVIWLAYNQYDKIQKQKEVAKVKITQDSLKKIARINDSISEIKRGKEEKIADSILTIKRFEVCNESNALANLKSYMKFYYPTWRMKDGFKVQPDGDCSYEISTLIKSTKYGGYGDFETLIVRISFWSRDYYQKYSVSIIKSPALFDE